MAETTVGPRWGPVALILAAGSEAAFERAVAALGAGEVVAIPTDTVYGLAVAAGVPGATARLFAAKGRPAEVALPVLVADVEEALALAASPLPPGALAAMRRWWPGPLTVVVERSQAGRRLDLGGDGETVGLRCPDHDLVRGLARRVGPLVATSANRHGRPTPPDAAGVAEAVGGAAALVLDGGRCAGEPSTVVGFPSGAAGPVLLRQGRLPWADLRAAADQGPAAPGA